ncbi:hypothetical protein DSM107007_31410 [Nostoc sp. PCC 7120 = FACHB-418]|nr:hypothetical protein DSM107007_31410 [Nostoc sp. PCC 7120 = FACHB-418]
MVAMPEYSLNVTPTCVSIGFQACRADGSLTNFTEEVQSAYKLFQQASHITSNYTYSGLN